MEDVVPWAPYLFDNNVDVTSARIVNYSFDQFAGLAAYDQYAIAPDAQSSRAREHGQETARTRQDRRRGRGRSAGAAPPTKWSRLREARWAGI